MELWKIFDFLERVVGPLEKISSEEELGRLLLEKMKFALEDEQGELKFSPKYFPLKKKEEKK